MATTAYAEHAATSFSERMQQYEEKVTQLQQQFQQQLTSPASTQNIGLHKNTSNLFRYRHQAQKRLDVRAFNQVLDINTDQEIATVEGMTTYANLVEETLRFGYLPAVVPELKSITVGGALAGVGIESSSFRYGLVHETITEFTALVGDGRVLTASPHNQYHDLFYAFANSYGSLGYALKVKVKLIPIKSYIKLTHQRFSDASAFFTTLGQLCEQNKTKGDIAFLDGTIFNSQEMYITQAEFVDQAPTLSDYKYMHIYYSSIQKRQHDYLTTADYIWRWDSDWFWCSKFFYMQNPLLRFLLGKWLLNSTTFWKVRQFTHRNWLFKTLDKWLAKPSETVIQDVPIPLDRACEFLDFFQQQIGIQPIWVCPLTAKSDYSLFPLKPQQWYVNFGFWDTVPSNKAAGHYNRLIENKVQELGGIKSLYSNVYYSEQEFWQIFDKEAYAAIKTDTDPNGVFADLYRKCAEKA